MQKEIWKKLIYGDLDLSERIEVSNTGKLRSLKTKKEYATVIHKTGYKVVCISLGSRNKKKLIRIHRAVAFMFAKGYKLGLVVNHKDMNKLNNNYDNLEWVTYKGNSNHAKENFILQGKWHGKKVRCIQTKRIFNSIAEASNWCGLKKSYSITRHIKNKEYRKYAGKDPITKEKLQWEFVE